MKKLKKSLSVLLTLVMLFTTLCFFVLPETGIKANAAYGTPGAAVTVGSSSYNRVDDVIICVPETIYMTPSASTTTTGQYFVNNVVDSSGKVTLEATRDNTAGRISIYAPGATSFSINVVAAVGSYGDPVIGGTDETLSYEGTPFNMDGYFDFSGLALTLDGTGMSAGNVASIKWLVTLSFADGTFATYYAYSTLYAPNYHSVGASAEARYNTDRSTGHTSWISGIHGVTSDVSLVGPTGSENGAAVLTEGYFVSEPLLNLLSPVKSSTESMSEIITADTNTKYVRGYHITDKDSSNIGSFVGTLTIDSSRYTNTDQIPNLYIGADSNEIGSADRFRYFYSWYTVGDNANYTTNSGRNSDTPSGWTTIVSIEYDNSNPTYGSNVVTNTSGITTAQSLREYVNNTGAARFYLYPSISVSSLNGKYIHNWTKSMSRYSSSNVWPANTYASVLCTTVDKTTLRNVVLQATSINRANYVNDFTHFNIDIEYAAYVLGNPCATQDEVDTAITRLQMSTNGCSADEHPGDSTWACPGLQINVYARRNYTASDNTEVQRNTVVIGTNVSYSYDPEVTPSERAGYDFIGWNADRTATTGSIPAEVSLYDEDKSVYAIWKIKQYTITFNTDGGSAIDSITADYGTSIAKPADPTKTGYTFAGWNITFPYVLQNNVEAKASWNVNQYTIVFDTQGGSTVDSITQDYGTAVTAPEAPAKTGYDFSGWSPALPETMPASNTTVSAIWTAKNYTITYDLNTDGVIDAELGEAATQYTIEDTVTLPSATSTNYNFVGWEVTAIENGNWVTKLYTAGETLTGAYGNVSLKAKWEIKKYTVNWVNWNGNVLETDSVSYGAIPSFDQSNPTRTADAQFTYTFTGWDNNIYTPVTEDITFTAQYSSTTKSYTVIWYDSDGTKLSEQTYLYGETPVYPNANPEKTDPDGRLTYTFKGWSPAIATVTANATYTAEYESVINTYDISFTYRDSTGTEKTVEMKGVEHGTSFSSLVPSDFASFYEGVSTEFNHSHYKASWTNAVDAITATADFVADYTLIANVTMSFTDDYKNSDCENTGLDSRECTQCGYKYEKEIAAKGHAWGDTPVSDTATCLEDGIRTYVCSRCDTTKEETSAAHGHSFTTASAAVPATCTTDGMASYKMCVTCDLYFAAAEGSMSAEGKADTDFFVIVAQGHSFTLTAAAAATCEADGHEAYNTCSVCKLYFAEGADYMTAEGTSDITEFTITKLGHDYEAAVTEPTCNDKGFTTYTCKNDSAHTYVDNYVDAKGHTPGEPVVENRTNASCTVAGSYDLVIYCTVKNCTKGAEYYEISREHKTDFVPHTYEAIIVSGLDGQLVAEKTCYSYAEYYKVCSMCQTEMTTETFFDEDGGRLDHTPGEIVKLPAVTATCTVKEEWDEVKYCTVEACKAVTYSEHVIGTTSPDNHAGHTTTTTVSNEVPGTCTTERTWTETVTCDGCKENISVTDKTGNKNVLNHTGEAEGELYVDTEGTCNSETVWRVDTICSACNEKTKTRIYKGDKVADNHTGGTRPEIENEVAGTCITANTWEIVTYCLGCSAELDRTKKTGTVDPDKHSDETYTQEENIVAGTCTTEKTWDVVTYCSDCKNPISTESHTGDKNPENHSGVTELRGNREATCGAEGYTGDLYWACCDTLEAEGEVIPMLEEHTPGEAVKENEIPATSTTDGEYDSVVYCSVCRAELSREHVIQRIERTISFVLKDRTVEVKAFSGDTVEAPETPEVQTEDGFWHYFMYWDKKIKPVTGDETYTAIYTEPCDYSELERLEAQLNEILTDGSVSDHVLAIYKEEIDEVKAEIKRVYMDRNYRDVSEQNEITEVTDLVEALIAKLCPDLGSTLVIEGSVVQYTGRTLSLRAVKMPSGTEVTDAEWTSSDDSIVFFANGKLYAVGTGSVTITAKRGSLKASVNITIVEGGDARGISFTSVDNTSFILEDTYQTEDGTIVFWSDDQPIRFRVHVSSSFIYEKYYVYINGEAAETDMDGYYTIPANSGDVKVTIAGEMIDTGAGEGPTVTKWSFWDWLMSFFRKIGDFFRGLFS